MVLVVKNPPATAGDVRGVGAIPGSGRFPRRNPLTAAHSSILAWRIPWTEEPGRLQSIASQRIGHYWSNLACMHVLWDDYPSKLSQHPSFYININKKRKRKKFFSCDENSQDLLFHFHIYYSAQLTTVITLSITCLVLIYLTWILYLLTISSNSSFPQHSHLW